MRLATPRVRQFLAALLLIASPSALAANIFDDNWTPPARPVTPPAETAPVPDAPAPPVTPIPSDPPPVVPIPVKPDVTAAVLRPIPTAVEQARLRTQFKEVFSKELADRSTEGRRALAAQLIEAADKSLDAPSDRFVLLMGARQAATEVSDLSSAVKVIDALAGAYNLDPLKMKLETALKAVGKTDSAAATGDNCRAALALVDQLTAADDYAGASRLAGLVQTAAVNDPVFSLLAPRRIKEIESLRAAHEKIVKYLVNPSASPKDPAACLAVGGYHCFARGDWSRGLPLLAKGSDASIRQLAVAELGPPANDEALQKVGDGWWSLAEKQGEMQRGKLREHAATLYKKVLDHTTGLNRVALEKRIAESVVGPRLIGLLPLIDLDRDWVRGDWALAEGRLTVGDSISRLELPYEPPDEYLFRVEFSQPTGVHNAVFMWFAKVGTGGIFTLGGCGNVASGLELIDGKNLCDLPGSLRQPRWIETGRRYVSIVEVRDGRVRGFIDGRLIADLKTDYKSFSQGAGDLQPRNIKRLALGTFQVPTIFHRAEVLELTGQGKLIK